MRALRRTIQLIAAAALVPGTATTQTLRGSPASVDRQYLVARQNEYSFLDTPRDVDDFVRRGILVPLQSGAHYTLAAVSYPYARPAIRTFVERIAPQYQSACGEPLVVTSLTRPTDRQPRNASENSVHPAGMAVDLRVSSRKVCRTWLEKTLLGLEKLDVLDVTREKKPSHYHVAIFPAHFLAYVDSTDATMKSRATPSGGVPSR